MSDELGEVLSVDPRDQSATVRWLRQNRVGEYKLSQLSASGELMAKVWVLDTDTKGTGARMVPLEDVLQKPDGEKPPRPIAPAPKPPSRPEPEPRQPRRFRVVDAMTREVLADEADARATLDLLGGLRSLVDVSIYVWQPKAERWRPLTLGEKQVMWARRPEERHESGRGSR